MQKDNEEWANNIIHAFITDYLINNITPETQALVLLPDKLPRVIGSCEVPNQISVFINKAKLKKRTDISVTSALTCPPMTPKQSYSSAAQRAIKNNRPKSRASSPTSQITEASGNKSQGSQFSAISTQIDNIIQRADARNQEMAATQSVIDT